MNKFVGSLFFILAFGAVDLRANITGVFILNKHDGSVACYEVAKKPNEAIKRFIEHHETAVIYRDYLSHIQKPNSAPDREQRYTMLSIASRYAGDHGCWVVKLVLINKFFYLLFGAGVDEESARDEADSQLLKFYGVDEKDFDSVTYPFGTF